MSEGEDPKAKEEAEVEAADEEYAPRAGTDKAAKQRQGSSGDSEDDSDDSDDSDADDDDTSSRREPKVHGAVDVTELEALKQEAEQEEGGGGSQELGRGKRKRKAEAAVDVAPKM